MPIMIRYLDNWATAALPPTWKLRYYDTYLVTDKYDEEFVKDVLSVIVEERTATEKQKAEELEEKQEAVFVAQQRERERIRT
ncbi:hypothetical protein TNCV_2628061 [Trichonephila clavipes]|nr:hypothetical protein TNCV_2628061 [Trichonephila clavipes]